MWRYGLNGVNNCNYTSLFMVSEALTCEITDGFL